VAGAWAQLWIGVRAVWARAAAVSCRLLYGLVAGCHRYDFLPFRRTGHVQILVAMPAAVGE